MEALLWIAVGAVWVMLYLDYEDRKDSKGE